MQSQEIKSLFVVVLSRCFVAKKVVGFVRRCKKYVTSYKINPLGYLSRSLGFWMGSHGPDGNATKAQKFYPILFYLFCCCFYKAYVDHLGREGKMPSLEYYGGNRKFKLCRKRNRKIGKVLFWVKIDGNPRSIKENGNSSWESSILRKVCSMFLPKGYLFVQGKRKKICFYDILCFRFSEI